MATDLTKGNCAKQIILFSVPLLIGNLFQQLYTVVDSMIVGKMVSSNALAAVGTSTPIIFFLTALLSGFIMGASIITSQYYGAKDLNSMRKSISTSFIMIMFMGLAMTVIGLFFSKQILVFLNTPPEVMQDAKVYLQIFSLSIIFQCLYQFPAGILRGIGDSKTPLYFLIVATVLNIILDIVFVFLFKNGVIGVAVATLIAQLIAAVACIIYTLRKYEMLRFKAKEFVFDKQLFKLTVNYGLPSSIQQVVGSIGMLFLQGLVNSFGPNAMAAYTSAYKIDNFIMLPIMNLGLALSSFVGQNVGARKIDRIKTGLKSTAKICIIFSLVASTIIYIFSKELMLLFVDKTDTEIIRLGSDCLRALSPLFFLCGLLDCYISFFKGVGDVNVAMAISISQIVIRIIVAYSLAPIEAIGINAVWWCMPVTWVICSAMGYIRYKSGQWKKYIRFS